LGGYLISLLIVILLLITVSIAGAGYSYISMYSAGLTSKQIEVTSSSCAAGLARITVKGVGTDTVNTTSLTVLDGKTGTDISTVVQWSAGVSESGKVLEMKFDTNANPTPDTSGSGNDGIVTGAVWNQSGKMGGAYVFNKMKDNISISDSPSFTLTNGYTITAWIYPIRTSRGDYENIITQWGGGGAGNAAWFVAVNSNNKMSMANYNTTSGTSIFSDSGNAISSGNWSHIAAVYTGGGSGTNAHIYVNGKLSSSGTLTSNPQNSNYDVLIGASAVMGTTLYFNGTIDEVRIYNRALYPEEILALATNSVNVQPGQAASFTHYCGPGNFCRYNVVSGGSVKEAMVTC
jgi:hypothetical protein